MSSDFSQFMMQHDVCRFAPSATGPAHPGTLLAGMLAWLDARSRGARFVIRIEDLDPQRCTPALTQALLDDLAWFGLTADAVEIQSEHGDRHAAALDQLAVAGLLYPCSLSRSELAAIGRRTPDGAWACDNRHRSVPLPLGGWRATADPLRVRLPDGVISVRDENGDDLSQDAATVAGDPVVRRRGGAIAYQLAVVVDDAAVGVTRVVRGADIAPSTATQVALQRQLGLPTPVYRHHPLLLEHSRDRKLSKFHGAIAARHLAWTADELRGFLACCVSMIDDPSAISMSELLRGFDWSRVATAPVAVAVEDQRLRRCLD